MICWVVLGKAMHEVCPWSNYKKDDNQKISTLIKNISFNCLVSMTRRRTRAPAIWEYRAASAKVRLPPPPLPTEPASAIASSYPPLGDGERGEGGGEGNSPSRSYFSRSSETSSWVFLQWLLLEVFLFLRNVDLSAPVKNRPLR